MSPTHTKKHATRKRDWETFMGTIRRLPLVALAGGLLAVLPASAQLIETVDAKTGTIQGTVVDVSSDPIPDATVVLQGPAGSRFTHVTKDDGSFAFQNVIPGSAYQISVTANGFADWTPSVIIEPGQEKSLDQITLSI